jgi:alkanesulfonate monooxygenase SsuD/methylene tetrahydromethanopterin reductase-like flavin-dependent oxidoreductase (luciferase family)
MNLEFGICLWTQAVEWPDALQAAELVDELGYDHLWTVDHLLAPTGDPDQSILEGWSVLSAWAARTERVGLGLFVAANPFRTPTYTAKLATTLDSISDGRAIVGLGAGWFEREHSAYGIPFGDRPGERIGWLDESASMVRRLLDGETVDAGPDDGQYRADDLRLLPRPRQRRLPMMIGGSGPKRTLRVVARYADMWNGFGTPEKVGGTIGLLKDHCDAVGRDIADIRLTVGANVIIREDRADTQRVWDQQMAFNRVTPETQVTAAEQIWFGGANEIADRLSAYTEIGIRGLIVEMAAPYDLETIAALAEKVRPQLDAGG